MRRRYTKMDKWRLTRGSWRVWYCGKRGVRVLREGRGWGYGYWKRHW